MFRSIMFVCALGAIGAVGCVATSDAADETAVAQNTGSSGALFNCQNVASISVVQCVGTLLSLNLLNVNVGDVSALNNDDLKVLNDDLNNLKIEDINILNVTNVANIIKSTVVGDFLNKFGGITVDKNNVKVCAPILGICI